MNRLRNIWILLSAIWFLFSSTGILVFHTYCACTGNDQVSVYLAPETCEEGYHIHHTHDQSGEELPTTPHECHECQHHTDDCGCNSPDVQYFRLHDQVLQEKLRMEHVYPLQVALMPMMIIFQNHEADQLPLTRNYDTGPPPLIQSSLEFLIQIHQLKIFHLA
ncbi:MAG: hypothetical protein PHS40_09025 [Mariniphaga sp.]|nr:hypothetical protein [Mariniphaga sp.]MDD4426055.1 hypothetical protein [Mariniphaga sp.]